MLDRLRGRAYEASLEMVTAKTIFFTVAIISIYFSVKPDRHYLHPIVFLPLALFCSVLISGGYEDLKLKILQAVGIEIGAEKSETRTASEVTDMISNTNINDFEEIEVMRDGSTRFRPRRRYF